MPPQDQESPTSKHLGKSSNGRSSTEVQTGDSSTPRGSENSLVQAKKRIKVYPERLNRVRAKKPKTRTGCRTCKIRRVKCGEEVPTCLRCDKFGIKCDGYAASQPQRQVKLFALAAKRQESPINILPKTALFRSETEHQYFLYFRDDIVLDLSGNIPDTLWSFIVLRASVEEPVLRDLSVAISALRKSQTYTNSPDAYNHHQFAIKLYGRALKGVQDVLVTYRQEEAIRVSLMASLLIFCFENTLGQHEQALAHIKGALMLLRKRLSGTTKPCTRSRTGSVAAHLEHEVLDAFVRLDNILTSRLGDPPDEPKTRRLQIKYSESFQLPTRFRDSVEAKEYLEDLQFKAMPFLSHMPEYLTTGRAYEPYIPLDEFNDLICHLEQFSTVFESTLIESSLDGDSRRRVAAATIRVQFLLTRISILRVAYGNNAIPADEFVEQSFEIVKLSTGIIESKWYRRAFVMSCDVLPGLFVVLLVCPRRDIKEEALRILKSASGRREVIWDAAAIAALGERILYAES